MSTRAVTVYVPVCDTCGAEGPWAPTPEDAATIYGFHPRGDQIACDRCAQDQQWADCKATFGEHSWIDWPHPFDGGERWETHPFTFWMPEKDGKPRWRMRTCGPCGYSEHQDEGSEWVSYRQIDAS